MSNPKQNYNVLDLFAGAGGLSLGFEKAGFSVVGAVEIWEPAIKTYIRNHPRSMMIGGDIRTESVKQQIRALHKEKPIDIVIGGFPCQGFSMAGNRDPLDTRSQLYQEYLNVVSELKPIMFLMENVKGLTSMKVLPPDLSKKERERFRKGLEKMQRFKDLKRYKAQRQLAPEEVEEFESLSASITKIKKDTTAILTPLLPIIRKSIEKLGYKVYDKVLNAADYGSAQYRDRIFIVGIRNEIQDDFSFPAPSHTKPRSVKEVIGDLEDAPEDPSINHEFTNHAPAFVKRIAKLKNGETLYKYSDAWWRLIPDQPSRTVKENHGAVFLHFSKNRVISPREMARLQDFSDDFIFESTKSNVLKQIGNAVPVSLSRAMGVAFKKFLTIPSLMNVDLSSEITQETLT